MDQSYNHVNTRNKAQPNFIGHTADSAHGNFGDSEQNFMLNTIQTLANDGDLSKQNFWMLAQYAMRHVRSLQHDLQQAQAEIIEKDNMIAELEKFATTDTLTGLANRRGILTSLKQEMDRTNRGLTNGGLCIMIDLDNFKTINDTYGHQLGDEALQLVAQTLLAHIRTMDVAGRMGGDEFFVIFSNAHPEQSSGRLQRLARKLNSLMIPHHDDIVNIRASIGVQPYKKGDSLQAIMHKADMAMYKTKKENKANK